MKIPPPALLFYGIINLTLSAFPLVCILLYNPLTCSASPSRIINSMHFFSAILYAVFSLPGLYGFLPLVGATIKSNFEVKGVALLGPFLFISAMTIVVLALMGNIQSVYDAEVPILILATKVFPVYGSIFAAVIFLGIYTTVTPLMWTICRRFALEHSLRFRLLAVILTLICWFGGNLLPFGQLINLIYPSRIFIELSS